MTESEKRQQAVQGLLANDEFQGALAALLTAIERDGFVQNPVAEMEALILQYLGWDTYGKTLTTSELSQWQINAVLELEAHFTERYEPYWSRYHGFDLNTVGLSEDAASLPDTTTGKVRTFFASTLPASLAGITGDIKSAKYVVYGTAAALFAATLYKIAK